MTERIREDYTTGHYIYTHSTLNDEIFYVGKGIGYRYKDGRSGRSVKWHEKTEDGFKWNIIATNLNKEEALELEKFIIQEAKELPRYNLVNGQRGGNKNWGNKPGKDSHWYGKKHSKETKELQSKIRKEYYECSNDIDQ